MTSIDFDSIKQRFDLARMIETEIGQPVRYGKNINCPFHADSTPSMTVYQDGHFFCHGCHKQGDLFDFLALLWDCDLRTVIDRLNEPGFVATVRHIPQQAKPETTLRPTLDPTLVDKFEKQMDVHGRHVYWNEQGISDHVLYKLRVGFTGERFTFPWFYRGILTAIKARRDDELYPDLAPKYISARGSRFMAPYNVDAVIDANPDTVLIVEDEKSVMAALRYKLAAVAAPANAWKADWCHLLADVDRIVIVADNDEPGMASARKIKGMIPRASIEVAPEGKDLFDFHLYMHERVRDHDAVDKAMRGWLEL